MKQASRNTEKRSQTVENNRHCETYVFNADEISLEQLLDPNFRPTPKLKPKHQPQTVQQVYYKTYNSPKRSTSTTSTQHTRYERASFDPSIDLPPPPQPFSTMPTRRRQPPINKTSIVHV